MEYREFINDIKQNILNYMPADYANAEVSVDAVMKNNNTIKQGLSIRRDGDVVCPKLYLEESYKAYECGESMENICNRIANDYMEHSVEGRSFDVSMITDFEKAKENITTKVVSAKNNKALMRERPHTKLDDLVVFYQVEVGNTPVGKATVPITNQIIKEWGVSISEVHKLAVDNAERMSPAKLFAMESVLFGAEENLLKNENDYEKCAMLVLTNEDKVGGANVIANTEVLNKVSEVINDSYYLLPSSVHETIVVPKEVAKEIGMTTKELGAMVRDVNSAEVSKEERLSDHIYEFDKDKKVLETVNDSKEKNLDMER